MNRIAAFFTLAVMALSSTAPADVIAAWTDSLLNVSTSVAAHSGSNAAGSVISRGPSLGFHSVGGNDAYSSNGWTTGASPDPDDYVQITADTSGYEAIVLKFNAYGGSSGPTEMVLRYSDSGPSGAFTTAPHFITIPNSSYASNELDLSAAPALEDDADVVFRIHGFNSFSLAGSARFAGISIEGSPISSVEEWILLDE